MSLPLTELLQNPFEVPFSTIEIPDMLVFPAISYDFIKLVLTQC